MDKPKTRSLLKQFVALLVICNMAPFASNLRKPTLKKKAQQMGPVSAKFIFFKQMMKSYVGFALCFLYKKVKKDRTVSFFSTPFWNYLFTLRQSWRRLQRKLRQQPFSFPPNQDNNKGRTNSILTRSTPSTCTPETNKTWSCKPPLYIYIGSTQYWSL